MEDKKDYSVLIICIIVAIALIWAGIVDNKKQNVSEKPNDDYSWCEWEWKELDTSEGLIRFANNNGMKIEEFIKLNSDKVDNETFYTKTFYMGEKFRIKVAEKTT